MQPLKTPTLALLATISTTLFRPATAVSRSGTGPDGCNLPAQSTTDINGNFATDVTIYDRYCSVIRQQLSA